MSYKKYEKSPFELIDVTNFDKRNLYDIKIHWHVFPPKGGKKYKLWVLMKKHVEYMIHLFSVMSTDELYKIKVGIEEGITPDYFKDIVQSFYEIKNKGGYLTSINLTNSEVFDYNNHESFKVPTEAIFKSRTLIPVVPNLKANIPTATASQIAEILRKR